MRKWAVLGVLLLAAAPLCAQIQRTYHYGVVPTENITTFEVNPATTVIDDSGGVSVSQVTLKTYRVINEQYNWGVEVPLSRYESPEKSVSGLGDMLANVSWFHPEEDGLFGFGAKMEFILPTATDKRLGAGKLQASPSAFVLMSFLDGFYAAAGYKHYVSVVGDHARDDINMGRLRANIGYTSPNQWWVLTNLYYYMDYEHSGMAEFIPELEIGTLVNDGTAFYVNASTHAAGNWKTKDWGVSIGFKLLYL
ncbi:hypothetical protein [Candidatus Avelusimicrobium alvi]|uniref:hypothetical protein n=1 Tax=Candidatus Avelusimicrobium alvi TaxID=3416221 RepID=UPI003D1238A9